MSEVVHLTPPRPKRLDGNPTAGERLAIRTDNVYVLFTTVDETKAAVRVASTLGKALVVPVTLIHFRAVPYPLPVDQPSGLSPVETKAFLDGLLAEGMEVRVRVVLCRRERRAIPLAFKPRSLIAVGGRRRRAGLDGWWPTRAGRWRRWLEAAGHLVLFVEARGQRGA